MAESWILRNMVYTFSRATKRGHRPREPEFLKLMEAAGLPIPDPSPHRSGSTSPLMLFNSFLFKHSLFMVSVRNVIRTQPNRPN